MKLNRIITFLFLLLILGQWYLLREGRHTLHELEQQRLQSLQRIDSLVSVNDSIDFYSDALITQVDSLTGELILDEKQLQRVRNEYKKRIDSLGKLSSSELSEYFTNRYEDRY